MRVGTAYVHINTEPSYEDRLELLDRIGMAQVIMWQAGEHDGAEDYVMDYGDPTGEAACNLHRLRVREAYLWSLRMIEHSWTWKAATGKLTEAINGWYGKDVFADDGEDR